MPGKLIQCLKTTGVTNPVVLIDEIDKLGTGFRGDPASALLEVLDPSQNFSFRDHFLDVLVDISKCLFICTANDLDRIPGPLLDRMEVIRLSGYDVPEKVAIAQQYLVPKSMRDSGLMVERKKEGEDKEGEEKKEDDAAAATSPVVEEDIDVGTPLDKYVHAEGIPDSLELTTDAINDLVRWYAREAGVRSLAKHIDKITRKLALQVVAEGENAKLTVKSSRKGDTWRVTKDNLHEYVGKKIFTSDRLYEEGPLPHGIVMGLAYTSMGGSALYIETQGIKRSKLDADGKPKGGGSLKVTGQLGDVMKVRTLLSFQFVAEFHLLTFITSHFVVTGKYPDSLHSCTSSLGRH
jgi:Lon-like ATP-dependent protease